MTTETKYPVKIVRGVEVVVMPNSVAWASCYRCPFFDRGNCLLEKHERCNGGEYYADPQKLVIARLQGKV